jgi:hypothetical protein
LDRTPTLTRLENRTADTSPDELEFEHASGDSCSSGIASDETADAGWSVSLLDASAEPSAVESSEDASIDSWAKPQLMVLIKAAQIIKTLLFVITPNPKPVHVPSACGASTTNSLGNPGLSHGVLAS